VVSLADGYSKVFEVDLIERIQLESS